MFERSMSSAEIENFVQGRGPLGIVSRRVSMVPRKMHFRWHWYLWSPNYIIVYTVSRSLNHHSIHVFDRLVKLLGLMNTGNLCWSQLSLVSFVGFQSVRVRARMTDKLQRVQSSFLSPISNVSGELTQRSEPHNNAYALLLFFQMCVNKCTHTHASYTSNCIHPFNCKLKT